MSDDPFLFTRFSPARAGVPDWMRALKPGDLVRWKAATTGGVWRVIGHRITRDRAGAGFEVDIVFPATGLEMIITRKAADAWEPYASNDP
jgi:hypothetical protein